MNRLYYYIGITGLFFAVFILLISTTDISPIFTLFSYLYFMLLFDFLRKRKRSIIVDVLEFNVNQIYRIIAKHKELDITNIPSSEHLIMLCKILLGQFEDTQRLLQKMDYMTYTEQQSVRYLILVYYIVIQDTKSFMEEMEKFHQAKNKITEENYKTLQPGRLIIDNIFIQINLTVLEDIWLLIREEITPEDLEEKPYGDAIYSVIKEYGIYQYYLDKEQPIKALNYKEQSTYLYDIIQEDFNDLHY